MTRYGRLLGAVVAVVGVVVAGVLAIHGSAPAAPVDPLGRVRDALAGDGPVVVSVLGDSTGNDPGEWVDLWAADLGRMHTVTLHMWNSALEAWKQEPIVYGKSGTSVVIWNGSQPGARATYPLDKMDRILPERPDFVLYSFGHNGPTAEIPDDLTQAKTAVDARWPSPPLSVLILQNPGLHKHGAVMDKNLDAVTAWAKDADVPTIDVASAFRQAPDLAAIMRDDAHPNDAGSALWAKTVAAALS